MGENWDIIEIIFATSMTLLSLLLAGYILILAYHLLKIAILKKKMYSEAVRTIEDMRIETNLFKHYRQKIDDQYFKRQKQLGKLSDELLIILEKLNFTCNEFKKGNQNTPKKDE